MRADKYQRFWFGVCREVPSSEEEVVLSASPSVTVKVLVERSRRTVIFIVSPALWEFTTVLTSEILSTSLSSTFKI